MADGRIFDEIWEDGDCIKRILVYSPENYMEKKDSPKLKKKRDRFMTRPRGLFLETLRNKPRNNPKPLEPLSPVRDYNQRLAKIPSTL
jgi:hypothetical protein